jgi:hypothetical protein
LNKPIRGLFTSLAVGAILTASSVVVLPVPVAAQDPDAEDVTLTVMASQEWIEAG